MDQTVGQELTKHIAVLEEILAAIKLQEEVLVSQSNATSPAQVTLLNRHATAASMPLSCGRYDSR